MPYGDAINHAAPAERHVTNMVAAVNFDYRALDTLGEEFMLLAAVTGTAGLLRDFREEEMTDEPATVPGRRVRRRSEAVVLISRLFSPVLLLFGIYVVLHGTVTPGGGFQGGVIIASALMLLYLAEGYRGWRRLMHKSGVDALEGTGAAIYVLAGLAPVVAGLPFLSNMLPLGSLRDMLSSGSIWVLNAAVGLAVAGGFSVLFVEFLKETRTEKGRCA